jgi:hypothetical protein
MPIKLKENRQLVIILQQDLAVLSFSTTGRHSRDGAGPLDREIAGLSFAIHQQLHCTRKSILAWVTLPTNIRRAMDADVDVEGDPNHSPSSLRLGFRSC